MPNTVRLLLLTLAAAGCSRAGGEPPARAAGAPAIPVRLAEVRRDAGALAVTGTGTVATRDEIPLGFKTGGVLAELRVREGDPVRAGQLLAVLDAREIDALVAKARAAVAKAERDHARAEALWRDSVVSLAQLQDAATARDVARADLRTALVNRGYATIVAAAPGTVLRRLAEPGQTVAPGAPVLVVGDARSGTVLTLGLPDRDAVRVRLGDRATVRLDAYPERALAATVRQIAGAATPGTGTVAVQLALDGAPALVSGLVGRARIAVRDAAPAATIPVESLVEADGDRATVFTLSADGAHAHRVPVRIAELQGARVVVRAGLDGVSRVIAAGAAYLDEGTPVRVAATR